MPSVPKYLLVCLLTILVACTDRSDAELPDHLAEFENVTVIPADATPQKTVCLLKQWEIGPDGDVLMDQLYALATDEHGNMYIHFAGA